MGERKTIVLFLLELALCCTPARAATSEPQPIESSLSYRRFTTLDGLPQMLTETVWQDDNGYIYIGTLSGFARYDGVQLSPFLQGRSENIVSFQEVAGEPLALGFVRQWSIPPHGPGSKNLKAKPIDPTGQLLLNNLNAADLPAGYVLLEDRREQNRALCRMDADGCHPVLSTRLLDEMTPDRKLCVDATGIYIPTPQGLFRAQDEQVRLLSKKGDVFSLVRTSGVLMALAADGIYEVSDDTLTLRYGYHFEAPDYGLSVSRNHAGGLYLSDSHTIWLFDETQPEPLQRLATGFNLIKGLFVDRWDRLWAATYQGAYCFFHCLFVNHRLTDKNDIVRAVADGDGHRILGTLNGKLIADGQVMSDLAENYYEPGAVSLNGKVYLAGNGDIVCVNDGVLEWLGLPQDRYRFVSSFSGRLIAGTRNTVLAYKPESCLLDTLTTEITHPWCAVDDGQGRLWVSGNPGLFLVTGLDEGGITVKLMKSTPTAQVITVMDSDRRGRLFFALGDSLFTLSDSRIRAMSETMPRLAGHEIRSIHVSPRGYLAVATIDGLLVAVLDESGYAKDIHWFDANNGFTLISPLMGPMAESDDGTVWLPGIEEMVSFQPGALLAANRESAIVKTPLPWWRRWWAWLGVAVLLTLSAGATARRMEQRRARRRMERLEREKELTSLQLTAVRLKAIPHFHANVLSGIEYFVMNHSPEEASRYLKLYADFTQQTLSDIDRPSRSIDEETDYIRGYLQLEKLRFGERLQYSIDVAPEVDKNISLPTMLLHTYCQNAVKHGIQAKTGPGCVTVTIDNERRDGADGVLVSVSDNGVGRAEAAKSDTGRTKFGLKILSQQIELYNAANRHKIVQQVTDLTDAAGHPAGTRFEIWVPAQYSYC